MRNRRPKDLPPIIIPSWFYERNVKLREHDKPLTDARLELVARSDRPSKAADDDLQLATEKENDYVSHEAKSEEASATTTEEARPVYRLSESIMSEIVASISAGLSTTRGDGVETFASGKSHLKLHCPVDGAIYFLERAIEQASDQLGADIIRIDAQDIAEIAGDYIKEGPEATANSLWSLGYDASQIFPRQSSSQPEDEGEVDEEGSAEDDEKEGRSPKQQFTVTAVPMSSINTGQLNDLFKKIRGSAQGRGQGPQMLGGGQWGPPMPIELPGFTQNQGNQSPPWNDIKLNALLECLLDANQVKRYDPVPLTNSVEGQDEVETASVEPEPLADPTSGPQRTPSSGLLGPRTIVMIRGFKELAVPQQGRLVLEKIQNIVQKKRKEGHPIMIVGTTASADLTPEFSREAFETLQNDGQQTPFRGMVVTPDEAGPAGGVFYNDAGRRIREINIRHMFALLVRLSQGSGRPAPESLPNFISQLNFGAGGAQLSALLDDQVFTFDEIHRIVSTALGNKAAAEGENGDVDALDASHMVEAMRLLDMADSEKTEWARNEQHLEEGPEEPQPQPQPKKPPPSTMDARLKKIRKQCNQHEKVLMRGVVNPENIRTTFKDVHAPAETIEALKTLTTLSLTRPEAFQYGVLATDKITGLLLYGPPGTGKTLLAKAVAKESGATVLEVSGSDVYDMYVGESEKNVRAIFSLARKLSPCVVFIDEADAIFASRGSGTSRNTHRELINQFLREWDGMTDTNAFIMVATNRPFDLDDAALRRLPRRLLVDLPTEKDRESILRIHLGGERLEDAVSVAELASKTPLYSGSDLKNLVVAAALAAVREENEAAARHAESGADEEFKFPERRVLGMRHFDKAMEEITASVSDDMSSLGAIRKFDEKYGDKRGKKKKASYGFGGGAGVKEDTAKVRS